MPVTISGDGTITGVEFPVPSIKEKRVAAFTGNGTWTVPTGVTYAIAHMMGGGGGIGSTTTGGDGSASSVAFASGTVTGPGLAKSVGTTGMVSLSAGAANTGQSAVGRSGEAGGVDVRGWSGGGATNTFFVAGAAVTPGASISVVVGAGGTAGTSGAAGGSGYVYIEYEIDPEDEI